MYCNYIFWQVFFSYFKTNWIQGEKLQNYRMEQGERDCYVGPFKDKVHPWFRDGKTIIGYCW